MSMSANPAKIHIPAKSTMTLMHAPGSCLTLLCASAERGESGGPQGAGALHVLLGEWLLLGDRGRRRRQAVGLAQAEELQDHGCGEQRPSLLLSVKG